MELTAAISIRELTLIIETGNGSFFERKSFRTAQY